MTDRKSLNRRSFLSRVAGGAVLGGDALSLVSGSAAFAITDHDPSDPSNRTGITDRDSTDRPGNGTGGATIHNGNSDNDANDAAGHPRGSTSPRTPQLEGAGLTDNDPVDARGNGRGPARERPTGISDQDPVDRRSYGRGPPHR